LLGDIVKDAAYFGKEGGITLSGGEPLLQHEAVLWLLREIKAKGLKSAVDTAGLVPAKRLHKILEDCDLFLYDLKLYDTLLHKKYTGRNNLVILENLTQLALWIEERNKKLWIRTPLIPGVTDTHENISSLAEFIKKQVGERLERWELCAFNNLCEHKYAMLGSQWEFQGKPLMKKERLDELVHLAKTITRGLDIDLLWTGRTAVG